MKVQAKRVKLGFAGKAPGLVLVEDRKVRGLERAGDRRRLVKVGRGLVQDQEPQDPA